MTTVCEINQNVQSRARHVQTVAPRLNPSKFLSLFASFTMSAICMVATPIKSTTIPVSASAVGVHIGFGLLLVSLLETSLATMLPFLGRMKGQIA